jgi:hypothetical protein
MATKSSSDQTGNSITEEVKDQTSRYNLSKFEYDLYHEEDDITLPIIRIKRISMPNKGERWKIYQDDKVVFTVEGSKLLNKEKDYLKTADGFNFLIAQQKQGIKSLNALRTELKKKIK